MIENENSLFQIDNLDKEIAAEIVSEFVAGNAIPPDDNAYYGLGLAVSELCTEYGICVEDLDNSAAVE